MLPPCKGKDSGSRLELCLRREKERVYSPTAPVDARDLELDEETEEAPGGLEGVVWAAVRQAFA